MDTVRLPFHLRTRIYNPRLPLAYYMVLCIRPLEMAVPTSQEGRYIQKTVYIFAFHCLQIAQPVLLRLATVVHSAFAIAYTGNIRVNN